MPVYHRTQRLQIYGEKPEVTQLFNDRYRIVVRCKAARDTEARYNDNKSQIFADFGTLYNAQMSLDGIDSRTGEAYDNMVLVSNAVGYTQTGDYVVTFVYETLTATWTKEQEDTVSSTDNGLRIVERSEVATIAATAPYDEDDIGTSTITSGGKTLYLAGFKDETKAESDAQIGRVTTQWLEAGTLSETLDNVGSQKAKVIEAIGPDPATPTGYSLASKQESSFNGFQTNRFTFLKNNVILSESEDKVGSQLAITQQWFNPADDPDESGYSVARVEVSDVDGIPTKRYTFLKNNVELSRTNDFVGSQLSITREFFNPASDPTESGYSLASKQQSDFEGIKTIRYVFLKDDVLLSQSEDRVGSQNAITEQWFKPSASRDTKADYSLARKEESDVEGIPTERFTFLKDNVVLSVSEDKVGSQKAVVNEVFNPTSEAITGIDTDGTTLSGYSEANRTESDYEGIKTIRVQFLKNNVELSRTNDYVGSQLAITREFFNPTSDPTETGYSLASKQQSDFEGIKTIKYVFLRDNILLSQSRDLVGSQNAIVEEWFNPSDRDEKIGYSVARREESNIDGIPTERYTFLKDNVVLSESKDKIGSQLSITQEVFNGTPATPFGYSIANEQVSEVDGISTKRFTFLKDNVKLSESKDEVGSQLAISQQWFNPDADKAISGYSLASKNTSDFEGIETVEFRFLKDDVILSESTDHVGSQLAIVKEVFNGTPSTPSGYSIANTQVSNVDGIPTKRYTFLKNNVELSRSEDKIGSQLAITTEVFNPTSDPSKSGYSVARAEVSDVDGIPTKRYTFLKNNVELSRSEDKVGSQLAITTEVFNPTSNPSEPEYSLAREEVSDVDGIPTERFTFLKNSILRVDTTKVGGSQRVSVQAFNMTENQVDSALTDVTSSHKLIDVQKSDYEGIKTSTFVFEVDDFEVRSKTENGLQVLTRTELSIINFEDGDVGTDTYNDIYYLAGEEIDNGNTINKRVSRWAEAGVISVKPVKDNAFSLTTSYIYQTSVLKASDLTELKTPNGSELGENLTWFEPEVINIDGLPTYIQLVIGASVGDLGSVRVHSYDKFYTITDPGVMSTDGAYAYSDNSGAAVRYPIATSQPRTYRKKATVDVYLTSDNSISEPEEAYNESETDWCSIAFSTFYFKEDTNDASVSANWRSFPNYLNSEDTTGNTTSETLGVYRATSDSIGEGSTEYNKTGVYRIELTPYLKTTSGTQLYLKTVVTF